MASGQISHKSATHICCSNIPAMGSGAIPPPSWGASHSQEFEKEIWPLCMGAEQGATHVKCDEAQEDRLLLDEE
jgi:hypothetical protein